MLNTNGFTAFIDTMIFVVIMIIAVSVTANTFFQNDSLEADPDDFLTVLSNTEVRLSDFTDLQDDSLVYITDVMAYSLSNESSLDGYLAGLLEEMYGKNRFLLTYSMGKRTGSVGVEDLFYVYQSSVQVTISTGDVLYITLSVI